VNACSTAFLNYGIRFDKEKVAMARIDWLDEKTNVPVIDEQVQKLTTFVEAMADGVIEKTELEKQQSSVVQAM